MKKYLQLKPNLLDYSSYGVKTGNLYSNNFPQDIKEFEQVIKNAKKDNFNVLFIRINSSDTIGQSVLKRVGAKKFDTLVTFKKEFDGQLQKHFIAPSNLVIELKDHIKNKKDLERIQEISASAFVHNHRSNDGRLPLEETQKFFSQWAVNNVKENASQIIIARVGDLLVGYIILLVRKNDEEFEGRARGIVDLIAVDKRYRGLGIGKALVSSSIDWFSKNVEAATVGTQKDNPAAFLYQECGFVEYKCEDTYHLWLDSLPK